MAIQVLDVLQAPFQGQVEIVGNLVAATSTEIKFVNDGYTLLYVLANASGRVITVRSIPDNAARLGNIVVTMVEDDLFTTAPLRPIWWNFGGMVEISLSSISDITLTAIRYQF